MLSHISLIFKQSRVPLATALVTDALAALCQCDVRKNIPPPQFSHRIWLIKSLFLPCLQANVFAYIFTLQEAVAHTTTREAPVLNSRTDL